MVETTYYLIWQESSQPEWITGEELGEVAVDAILAKALCIGNEPPNKENPTLLFVNVEATLRGQVPENELPRLSFLFYVIYRSLGLIDFDDKFLIHPMVALNEMIDSHKIKVITLRPFNLEPI